MQITPLLADTTGTNAAKPQTNVTGDYNRFLTLLTAQLQNQDPLAPMDATQFTNQLVQFSQVEQSVHMNQRLGDLLKLQEQGRVHQAVSYVGRSVDALGQEFPLTNGHAEILYAVDGAPAETVVQIFDGKGTLVRTLPTPAGAGPHRLAWNGKDALGTTLPDGLYRMQVTAKDGAGRTLPVQMGFSGLVEQVENITGEMVLSIGGIRTKLADIVAVRTTLSPGS